jgi:hypothetical protein
VCVNDFVASVSAAPFVDAGCSFTYCTLIMCCDETPCVYSGGTLKQQCFWSGYNCCRCLGTDTCDHGWTALQRVTVRLSGRLCTSSTCLHKRLLHYVHKASAQEPNPGAQLKQCPCMLGFTWPCSRLLHFRHLLCTGAQPEGSAERCRCILWPGRTAPVPAWHRCVDDSSSLNAAA